jgi:NADP-dependent aldehyde dehydrogenase
MTTIISRDARTGDTIELPVQETAAAQVAALARHARTAEPWLRDLGTTGRAGLLRRLATAVEEHTTGLVDLADKETGLGAARLRGEVARTAWQLRFLADVVADAAYLELTVDHASPGPLGPQPDLRRMLVPLGPIAVFGASNFPFAFSTIGGDSASALAVGCPVVFKSHPGHPQTATAVDEIVRAEIAAAGGPEGVFRTIFGMDAGVALVEASDIAGVGFTGSLTGGRALFDRAVRRPAPIPFYGELGSVNPLVVTPAAARERAADIGTGIAESLLLSAGQFCTKPGLLLVPAGPAGDALVAALSDAVAKSESGPLLTDTIATRFVEQTSTTCADPTVELIAQARCGETRGMVVQTSTAAILQHRGEILEEHFGPFAVVVRYTDHRERDDVLDALPPALTGTVHAAANDPDLSDLVKGLTDRSGRVIVNGYPTGVAVSWSMHHGGPYPASTASADTSVGAASVRRWLRPVTFQNTPSDALPIELRDESQSTLPQRLNGVQLLATR